MLKAAMLMKPVSFSYLWVFVLFWNKSTHGHTVIPNKKRCKNVAILGLLLNAACLVDAVLGIVYLLELLFGSLPDVLT